MQIFVWAWSFSGEEAGTLSGFTAPSVVNSVLLKCRKLRREDQETSDWNVSRILYSMTCLVICSHRKSHLKSFLQGSYRQNWRRDFLELEVETKHQRKQTSEGSVSWFRETSRGPINLSNPRLARTKPICRSKVESLSSLTHWQKAQLSQAQMVRKRSQAPLPRHLLVRKCI